MLKSAHNIFKSLFIYIYIYIYMYIWIYIYTYIYIYIVFTLRESRRGHWRLRGLEAWRLGGWRFGASGILERRHRRCLEGTWERWAPAFLLLRLIQKYVVMSLCVCVCVCVCVFRRTCCVCKCFQRLGAPAIFSLWIIHRA